MRPFEKAMFNLVMLSFLCLMSITFWEIAQTHSLVVAMLK